MRSGKVRGMAREAARSVIGNGFRRLVVRIVTSTAPEPAVAVARARAQGELLDVADYLEITGRRSRRHGIVVDGVGFLQPLSGDEVAELFPGVRDTRGSKQMALFADAVARAALQFRRVNDRGRTRVRKMLFDRSVTPLAGNSFGREYRRSILIQSAGNMQRGS